MKKLNHKIPILLILALGIILRMIYVLEIRRSPFFYSPFGDPDFFDRWALNIAQGDIIGKEIFFKAPLYPYVLSFFYRLLGHNLIIPRLLNIFFDGFSILLLFLLGKKMFNRKVGLIAAIAASVSGILIYFTGEILGTSLGVLLSLSFLYLLLVIDGRMWRWFCTGFVLSLAIIVRPNFLLCIPFILLYVFSRRKKLIFKIKSSTIFLAGALSLLLITGVRNYIVARDFVLINYSGGVNFYIGNNAESDGVSAVLPGYGNDWDEYSIAEIEMKRELKPGEVSRFWLMKGFGFIKEHPGHFVHLFFKKCYLLWNGKEISNNQNIYRYGKNSLAMKFLLFCYGSKSLYFAFPSSLVLSLGLSGIFLTLREKKTLFLPYLLIASYGLSVVLFFVSSRYRMGFFVFIIPFSAYSIYWFTTHIREKKSIFIWVLSFIPFLFLSNFDPYKTSMENAALESYNLGNAYLRVGELDKAKNYYKRGLKENFYFPRLHLNLGAVYFKQDNFEDAEKEYQLEIKVNPDEARAYHNLSLLYEREGKVKDAIFYERKAVEKRPRFVEAHLNLGKMYVKESKYDSALGFLEKADRLKKNDSKILSLLGFINLELKNYDRTIFFYEKTIELVNDVPIFHYNLAVAYIARGNLEEARKYLINAISLKRDFAAAHYNLGMIHLKEGNTGEAKKEFEEALRIQPNLIEAKKMIEKME
ncbi:MAG: tetratricopeptide repeat protein [Candidatus Cloacimonadota bacterium]|nr:MAG: tetratricopeptide repeat protein [Candidatus Cloacimonadota bacterium]